MMLTEWNEESENLSPISPDTGRNMQINPRLTGIEVLPPRPLPRTGLPDCEVSPYMNRGVWGIEYWVVCSRNILTLPGACHHGVYSPGLNHTPSSRNLWKRERIASLFSLPGSSVRHITSGILPWCSSRPIRELMRSDPVFSDLVLIRSNNTIESRFSPDSEMTINSCGLVLHFSNLEKIIGD